MSNKNSLGIAHYLNSEKLLTKDTIMHPKALSTTKKPDASAFRKNPPYSLLNQPQESASNIQKQQKEMQSEKRQSGKNIDMVFKYENELKKKQQLKYNYSENKEDHILVERKKSKQKKRAINRDPYQIALEQQQFPTTWQTVVINSSKKYFDSCRMEALNFIKKIQEMLKKQKIYVHNQLIKINSTIEQSHVFLAQSLKQYLYKMIDQAVEEWRNASSGNFSKSKIKYIGELYELNTQLQQRHKQIILYGEDLNSEKEWKNRASDLLTSNYEANLAELSKQCKKSVENTYDNLNLYFKGVETKLKQKLSDQSVSRNISNKIGCVLNSQLLENQDQKQILRQNQEKREIEEERRRKQREILLKQTYNNYRYPRYLSTALKGHQKFLKNHIHICEICHQQISDGNNNKKQIETSRFYAQNQREQMSKQKQVEVLNKDEREGENTRVKQYHNQPNERSSNIKISLFRTK